MTDIAEWCHEEKSTSWINFTSSLLNGDYFLTIHRNLKESPNISCQKILPKKITSLMKVAVSFI